jgi:glycosyltransferase involved in cell wall biosynthesis
VHVLVPAYGPSPYLRDTLRSIVAAARDDTKITVLDDGTTGPQVRNAANVYADHVQYIRSDRNIGVAGSFQRCVDFSCGTYTVIMGSDDLLEPWYFDEIRDTSLAFGDPAMVLPGVTVVDGEGVAVTPTADRVKRWLTPRGGRRLLGGEGLATRLLLGNWLYFPAIAWRTDLLRAYGFRQDLATVLDLDLELRLVFDGEQLAWSPRRSFRYRRHGGSASSIAAAAGERFAEEAAVFSWASEVAAGLGWRHAARAARLHPTSRIHAVLARLDRARAGTAGSARDA